VGLQCGNFVRCSPAVGRDGTVYVGSQDWKLYAINGKTGDGKWAYRTPLYVNSSPAIGADGNIYVGSYGSKFFSLTTTGRRNWVFDAPAGIHSSPAIGPDGTIYFGCRDHKVYALNGADARSQWYFPTGDMVRVVAGNRYGRYRIHRLVRRQSVCPRFQNRSEEMGL